MNSWANLLGENPCIAPDIQFRVTEEVFVDGKLELTSEVLPAHKFVLAMASDVFKAQFYGPMKNEKGEVLITGTTVAAFKEFLRIIYTFCINNCKNCNDFEINVTDAETLFEVLSLCKMYLINTATTFVEDIISSIKMTDENIVPTAIVADKWRKLEGFEGISKTVLRTITIFLKKNVELG